jgi:DNA-binding IclR family transcriptional regulator
MAETLQSVAQALRILKLIRDEGPLGVADVARRVDVSASTAHRLLATLREHEFVEQTRVGGKYAVGQAMAPPQSLVERTLTVGAPHLVRLRDLSAETVHLAVLQGVDTHFVVAYESPHIMRVTSRVGRSLPAAVTAAGKLLLACLPQDEVRRRYEQAEAAAMPVELDGLLAELELTHERGFGRNLAESELGVAAIAVPVHGPDGVAFCSVTLTGPDSQYNPAHTVELSPRERELLEMLRRTARDIEAELAAIAVAPKNPTEGPRP